MLANVPPVAHRLLPHDLPGVHVDGGQRAVRRIGDGEALYSQRARRRAIDRVVRDRGLGICRGDAKKARFFGRLHEQVARGRVDRRAAPVPAPDDAGHRQRALERRWCIQVPEPIATRELDRLGAQRGCQADQVVFGETLLGERRRLRRERLHGRGYLAGHATRENLTFLDRPHGLPALTVKRVHEAGLADDGDCVHSATIDLGRVKNRGCRQVVVPEAVVNRLEVPEKRSRARVHREQRLGVEVVAEPVPSVVVVARSADAEVEHASLLVDDHGRPRIGVSCHFFGAVLPCLVPGLPLLRDQVEVPDSLPRAHVERLKVAGRIVRVDEPVPYAVAEDDEILEDQWRRRLRIVQRVGRPQQVPGQVDFAAVAERLDLRPRSGVDGDQPPARIQEDPPLAFTRPHRDAAVHEAGSVRWLPEVGCARVVCPELLARPGVQRDDTVVWGRQVHGVRDHDRRDLEVAGSHRLVAHRTCGSVERSFTRFPGPGDFEGRDVATVDGGQRRELRAGLVAAVEGPVGVSERFRGPRDVGGAATGDRHQREDEANEYDPFHEPAPRSIRSVAARVASSIASRMRFRSRSSCAIAKRYRSDEGSSSARMRAGSRPGSGRL